MAVWIGSIAARFVMYILANDISIMNIIISHYRELRESQSTLFGSCRVTKS